MKKFFRSKKCISQDVFLMINTQQQVLFGKRHKRRCLSKASNYLTCMRICELADHCCVIKSDRGFNIKVDMNKNPILLKDITEWLLTRKIKYRYGNDFGTIENIFSFKIYK